MSASAWLETVTVVLRLAKWQQFGLAFLLGSFAVATWSDLKRLSAQREFVEIWILFVLAILGFDLYHFYNGDQDANSITVGIKWGLIAIFSLLSWRKIGILLSLAPADVGALAAAASLLPPILVVIFYVLAKVLAMITGPLLARGRPNWPFMPVVSLSTIGILALGWLM